MNTGWNKKTSALLGFRGARENTSGEFNRCDEQE
jgi:hypothetical protein